MPSVQLERKAEVIRKYVSHLSPRPNLSEHALGIALIQLLKDLLLEANPEFLQEYLQGVEQAITGPKTTIYSRGRADAFYGNLLLEFKRTLAKSIEEARGQLRRYVSILQSRPEDRNRPLICMATDGLQFVAYAPRFAPDKASLTPEDVSLVEIESANLEAISPHDAYYWLDRYFARQTGPLSPKTKQIVEDFGPNSGSYVHTMNLLSALWRALAHDTETQVFYDSWQKYLRITYGGPVTEQELFLRHTYLATLSKLMVWVRLTGATEPPPERELRSVLNGRYFAQRGIQNFLEEDFFAWPARDAAWSQALIISRRLLFQLATYNLKEVSEDVLKGLYERLVDPKDRHDLGEYYTPDWLAAKIVQECLQSKPEASVLDPACGSGTFLYQTILFKRDKLGQTAKVLKHIQESVVGIDIHPLAVIVAKTTYLLGLGDLLEKRLRAIRIPVYLADSIKPPEQHVAKKKAGQLQFGSEFVHETYGVSLNGDVVNLPETLALSDQLYDRAIELCSEYARLTSRAPLPSQEDHENFLRRNELALIQNPAWKQALYELFRILRKKIQDRKDTIWAFVLKNVFKPLLLKGRFDVMVGNPPWLSYRYVERGAYQAFLKGEITGHYHLLTGRPELLTQMDLGTLFFLRCADLYLCTRGRIGFVLPKSIFVADQHHALRKGSHAAPLRLTQVWDLEAVRPLFNVPASVVFGQKSQSATDWPLLGRILACKEELSAKNASSEEAEKRIAETEARYWLSIKGNRSYFSEKEEKPITEGSLYAEGFANGATIYPRPLWFVQIENRAGLGRDTARPYIKTDPRAIKEAKKPYDDVCLEGNVESEFLYQTLLSTDLVPFGHLPFRAVVLPILPKDNGYEMLTASHARRRGYLGLAQWLERCETIWNEKRGEKAERVNVYDWLDYRRKLTQQRQNPYTVIYPKSSTYLCSMVLEADQANAPDRGFFADHVLYIFYADSCEEAH